MDRELQILTEIWENPDISQRSLSEIIGQSLGSINAIIQQMIKDGLIITENKSSNIMKYFLTPKGKELKAQKTYNEIANSFKVISKLKFVVKKIIQQQVEEGIKKFYIIDNNDEVYKIVKMALIEAKRKYNIEYILINDIDTIENNKKDYIIIVWDIQMEEDIAKTINILNYY